MKYLLFDFDGTLVDTADDIAAAANHILGLCDRPPLTTPEVLRHVGAGALHLVAGILPDQTPTQCKELLACLQDYYRDHATDLCKPYPGVIELLQSLPPGHAAVVSNKPEGITRQIVEALDLDRFFVTILGALDGRPLKPDPAPVHLALEAMGARPDQAAVVGDGWQDMAVAKAAGCTALGVAWGFHGPDVLSDHGAERILASPAELLEWWRTWI